jgi:DNA-binding response OmpR family regulator
MADWVIVVDDDETNLKMAGHILSRAHMRVTAMKSGRALLDYIREREVPDLILLDIKMPGIDGFETLTALRTIDKGRHVPVIFLTADEKEGTEVKGLSLGAMDFIKKPFVPEVLTLRVRHMIDLDHLQRKLEDEVEKKTRENERLFLHVV